MTRINRTLVANDGYEVCLFPMDVGYISQYSHEYGNAVYNAYDLAGNYDSTTNIREEVYAPCSMTVVKSQLGSPQYSNNVIFKSDNPVYIPGETSPKTIFICMTHCDDIAWVVQKGHFNQGELCYYEGTYGGSACTKYINGVLTQGWGVGFYDIHLHIEVTLADASGSYGEIVTPYYSLKNSRKLEEIFYVNGITEKYAGALSGFQTYSGSSEWNGWIADGSEWYYYENGVKVSGWIKTSDGSFYLDPSNGNAMATGWIKIDGSWFYLNPKDGEVGHNDKYVGGAMLTGWVKDGADWYWMSPTSGVMQVSTWVAAANGVWYYVLSSGKMAVNCQIKDGGKYYAFAGDGKCINSAGQTTQYNTTTYPIKS